MGLQSLAQQPQSLAQAPAFVSGPAAAMAPAAEVWRRPWLRCGGSDISAGAIAAAGPDLKAAGPDFEAAGPDFEAAGPDFEAAGGGWR